ncbi:MAG: hypothetical protein M3R29_03865 [Verrucomicrobiota bacterium]|nr:hypothetical protein [Verrucomicrobiota bacterium]
MSQSAGFAQLVVQLFFALIQCLETKLPAMQLNAVLIDVAGDFSALRFVFS